MKKIINLVIAVAISMLFSFSANAQIKLGLNGGIQVPTEDGAKTGFGGGINGEYLVTPNIGVGLNAGYYSFGKEEAYGISTNSYLIPVTLTGKYYFLTESIQPYGGVDVGFYTIGAKAKYQGISESASDSYFGFAPVVGLQFKLSDALALDINAKYNLIFSEGESTSIVGFNIGIVYTFGK